MQIPREVSVQQNSLWATLRREWGNGSSVDGDLEQSLPAEPGFGGVAPSAADVVESGLIHGAYGTLRVGANPLENLLSLPAVPAEPGRWEIGLGRGVAGEPATGGAVLMQHHGARQRPGGGRIPGAGRPQAPAPAMISLHQIRPPAFMIWVPSIPMSGSGLSAAMLEAGSRKARRTGSSTSRAWSDSNRSRRDSGFLPASPSFAVWR